MPAGVLPPKVTCIRLNDMKCSLITMLCGFGVQMCPFKKLNLPLYVICSKKDLFQEEMVQSLSTYMALSTSCLAFK